MQSRLRRTGIPSWLYVLVVASLGVYFIIGGIAWAIIAYDGRNVPDSFATLLATIAGGLVGVLAPAGSSTRPSDEGDTRS